ncbi:MAG: universal stress protein [Methanocellales archaeon]|nr:universal stress protein [Methanocellales archaeon]
MISKLLLPVNGSSEAEKATRFALQFAKDYGVFGVSVTALNVIPVEPPVERRHEEESERTLARIKNMAKELGVECDTKMIADPDVYVTIIREAEEGNYDMIIMGSRGLTGLKRITLGSVADAVIRNAHCPVTVVRQ